MSLVEIDVTVLFPRSSQSLRRATFRLYVLVTDVLRSASRVNCREMSPKWPFLLFAGLFAAGMAAQELPFTHFAPGGQALSLPSASVQKIIQDHQGYIWMAFYSTGIARYDGRTMESYGVGDGISDPTVREIVE